MRRKEGAQLKSVASSELASAMDAMDASQTRRSLQIAHRTLARAVKARDRHTQARASLVMAQAFVLRSRMEVGSRFSSDAASLFGSESDAGGQADALSVQSYCASAMGRTGEAIELASRGISLRADRAADASTGVGLNYFGVASFWAGDFSTARGVLDASIWYGLQQGDAALAYQPLVNACFTEVLRITEREGRGLDSDLSELSRLVARAQGLRRDGERGFVRGSATIGLLLLDFCSCFLATKAGRPHGAEAALRDCIQRAGTLPRGSWLRAVPWWARMERKKAIGDIAGAIHSGRAMATLARTGEHESLARLAERSTSTLLDCKARHPA
jgi:hypothetical protein